jgi:hypothetical protein
VTLANGPLPLQAQQPLHSQAHPAAGVAPRLDGDGKRGGGGGIAIVDTTTPSAEIVRVQMGKLIKKILKTMSIPLNFINFILAMI